MWKVKALFMAGGRQMFELPTKGDAYEFAAIVAENWERCPERCIEGGLPIAVRVEDGYGWNVLYGDTAT